MAYALLAGVLVLLLAAGVVTALKGKWATLVVGLLLGAVWFFGAIRLAKPNSFWARRFYDESKRERARRVAPARRKLAIPALAASVLVSVAVLGLLKAYRVPASSMEPALRCGGAGLGCTNEQSDRVIAFRYLFRKEPGRGDIVAFETPERAQIDCGAGGTFIKRVIALPGETWEMRNGFVYIDGERLNETYVREDRRDVDTRPPERIPVDSYLVMGDNRAQSCDSRVWGSLPRDNLIARVVLRYHPFDRLGTP